MRTSAIWQFGNSVIPGIRGCQPDWAGPGRAQRRSYAAQATPHKRQRGSAPLCPPPAPTSPAHARPGLARAATRTLGAGQATRGQARPRKPPRVPSPHTPIKRPARGMRSRLARDRTKPQWCNIRCNKARMFPDQASRARDARPPRPRHASSRLILAHCGLLRSRHPRPLPTLLRLIAAYCGLLRSRHPRPLPTLLRLFAAFAAYCGPVVLALSGSRAPAARSSCAPT